MGELTDIAIYSRKLKTWIYSTRQGSVVTSPTPKYVRSLAKAEMIVRVDMGLNRTEVEYYSRSQVENGSDVLV